MLVSEDELIAFMSDINLNTRQRANLTMVLNGVQEDLETYLNRPLEPVQIREVVRTDWQGYTYFTYTPVRKIIAVQTTEPLLDPDTPYVPAPMDRDPLVDDDDRVLQHVVPQFINPPGKHPSALYVGDPWGWYIIEYVAGYDGYALNGLKLAIMRVASRDIETTDDDTLSLRDGNAERATPPDTRPTGWTDDELKRWDRFRRRVVV